MPVVTSTLSPSNFYLSGAADPVLTGSGQINTYYIYSMYFGVVHLLCFAASVHHKHISAGNITSRSRHIFKLLACFLFSVPEEVTNLEVTHRTNSSLTLAWDQPRRPVDRYKVRPLQTSVRPMLWQQFSWSFNALTATSPTVLVIFSLSLGDYPTPFPYRW